MIKSEENLDPFYELPDHLLCPITTNSELHSNNDNN